jgi:molybdenum cofactor biosynthesis protein B
MSESTRRHQEEAERLGPIRCAVLTVSDTRTEETDGGGPLVASCLEEAGHEVVTQRIVPDDLEAIQGTLLELQRGGGVRAVILTGGTGIAARDVTPEAVEGLIDRRIEGFGELFRMLSWEEIGAAAMLSRAVGGLMGTLLVFAIPGSTAAVQLAMEKLILPELRHIVDHSSR